jgi:hypothetical protein
MPPVNPPPFSIAMKSLFTRDAVMFTFRLSRPLNAECDPLSRPW